jgi:low temperature requirement protein LtrA
LTESPAPHAVPALVLRMRGRSATEPHRAATPLELFFDLVFVVAVAQASAGLHHALIEDHVAEGLVRYGMAFFGIWWAWMNFTWFASAYDCDDVPYRIKVFVQMTGALIYTAGIEAMFARQDFTLGIIGYVVMRLAMVAQWLRAARGDPAHRVTAQRYAIGIAVLQVGWVGAMYLPAAAFVPAFVVGATLELLVPVWAEKAGMTPWHPHHIAERYGLMTIIVLGESILAASIATREALTAGGTLAELAPVIVGGLLTVYMLWWYYFERPMHERLTSFRRAFTWGYGHFFVYAGAAAIGAGLAVAVDQATGRAHVPAWVAGAAVAWPAALYVGSLWLLHGHDVRRGVRFLGPPAVLLLVLSPAFPGTVPVVGALLTLLLALKMTLRRRLAAAH